MARDRGGDVQGECKTDVEGAVGSPITVADASYDPGYPFGDSLGGDGYTSEAALKQGYCSYGVAIGEGRPKGMK
jgi:hypothetical protein